MLRYGLYGTLFTAPTLYGWVRLSSRFYPQGRNLKTAIKKAVLEQVTYGPSAMACFFFFMEWWETYSLERAQHEVAVKFWPTYKVALCFWPFFQTINFTFVREKNRVPIIGLGSLAWTVFLAYMKQKAEDDTGTNAKTPLGVTSINN